MFGLSAAHFLLAGALVGLVDVAGSSRCSETLAAESAPYWFWYQNGGAEHYWQHPIDPVNNRSGTACWEPADCKDASEMGEGVEDAGGAVHGCIMAVAPSSARGRVVCLAGWQRPRRARPLRECSRTARPGPSSSYETHSHCPVRCPGLKG